MENFNVTPGDPTVNPVLRPNLEFVENSNLKEVRGLLDDITKMLEKGREYGVQYLPLKEMVDLDFRLQIYFKKEIALDALKFAQDLLVKEIHRSGSFEQYAFLETYRNKPKEIDFAVDLADRLHAYTLVVLKHSSQVSALEYQKFMLLKAQYFFGFGEADAG